MKTTCVYNMRISISADGGAVTGFGLKIPSDYGNDDKMLGNFFGDTRQPFIFFIQRLQTFKHVLPVFKF